MFLKLTRILNKTLLSFELSVILKKGLSDRSVDTDALGLFKRREGFKGNAYKQQHNMLKYKTGDVRVKIKIVEGPW